jgi:hypothetical protein
MNENDKQAKKYEYISKIIFEIKDTVPNFDLNPYKTEQFFSGVVTLKIYMERAI